MEPHGALPVEPGRLWRLSVSDYHRMIGAGVFDEDDHVELLEGVLVAMSPQSVLHARILRRLDRWLQSSIAADLAVCAQLPLTLGPNSEPEPDLAVVPASEAEDGEHHPRTALLVIEVAGSSLAYDRGPKARTYASAGVPEYWIVDAEEQAIEIRRNPDTGSYLSLERRVEGAIAPSTFRCAPIALNDLFR